MSLLVLVLVGAGAGFGVGTWWIGSGSTPTAPIPAQIEPVVTSPALPPRTPPPAQYEDVDLGLVSVDIPPPPPPRRASDPTAGELEHVVQAGETLSLIAALYGVSVADIAAANNIADVSVINVGQVLIIPG